MQSRPWIKPGIIGAIAGSIATMIIGFSQAGWVLGSTADRTAEIRSAAAVTDALVPFCVSQSKADPNATAKLGELAGLTSSYQRREFVMKTGWATMPTAEAPNANLAEACAEVLSKAAAS